MNIQELIKKLQTYDPEEKACTYDIEQWVVEIKEVEEISNRKYNSKTKKREKQKFVYIN